MNTPREENYTIGITGGIGTGKSVVSRVLRCNGYFVYDCDTEAKRIMNEDDNLKNQLILHFGKDIYLANGELDRHALASIIFSNSVERSFVNALIHAEVKKDINSQRTQRPGLFFIESAILISSGLSEICDFIWLVSAPLDERISRVSSRDSVSYEEIRKRIEAQKTETENINLNKTTILKNGENDPLLIEILSKTEINIDCNVERDFIYHR